MEELRAAGDEQNQTQLHSAAATGEHGTLEREVIAVVGIAVLALLLRLWYIPARIMVEGDGVWYASLARAFLQGDMKAVLNPYWSNLWIAAIALFAWPSGDVVLAGRLVSAITGAALVIPCYLVARAAMGRSAGLLAGCLIAIHPWLLRFSSLVYSEPLFNLLLMTAIALAVAAIRRRSLWWWAALGVVTLLGMLTREAAGAIVLLLPVLAWLAYRRRASRREIMQKLAVFIAVVVIGMGCRYAIGRAVFGSWTNAGFGLKGTANLIIGDSFYDTVALETLVHEVDSSGRTKYHALLEDGRAWEYVLSDPKALVRRIVKNAYYDLASSSRVLPPVPMSMPVPVRALLFVLAAYGVLACWRRAEDVAAIVLGAFVLTTAPLLLFFIHDRMVLPLAPLFCLAVAFALADLAGRSSFLRALVYASLIVCLFMSVRWVQQTPTIYATDPVVQKEAGLWLRATQPQSIRLMSYDPFTPFYFYDDNPLPHYMSLPLVHTPAELVDIARLQKADVIAVAEWFTRLGGPEVAPLLRADGEAPAGLERLVILGASPTRLFIYKVRPVP